MYTTKVIYKVNSFVTINGSFSHENLLFIILKLNYKIILLQNQFLTFLFEVFYEVICQWSCCIVITYKTYV